MYQKIHLDTLYASVFVHPWDQMDQNCQNLTKNTNFGVNLAVFGPKILIFMGVSESFGTNITENHLDNLPALFFGQALDQMGQKNQYLAENWFPDMRVPKVLLPPPKNWILGPKTAKFGPKLAFWAKYRHFWPI